MTIPELVDKLLKLRGLTGKRSAECVIRVLENSNVEFLVKLDAAGARRGHAIQFQISQWTECSKQIEIYLASWFEEMERNNDAIPG